MVIATFGPSTAWVGKTITFENGRFILEGMGPIPAANVLAYDRERHLSWAYAGLREWVEQAATGGVVPETVLAAAPVVATAPVARPAAVAQPVQGKKRLPVWAIVLMAVAAVVVLGGAVTLAAVLLFLPGHAVLNSVIATVSAQESGSTEDLLGVAFSDAVHGWAVGEAGLILATTDGGATWSAQDSGSSVDLGAVACTGAGYGWVVGKAGAILATSDGGATWSAQDSGSSADLRAVTFSDVAHGWAVGADGAILAITSSDALP